MLALRVRLDGKNMDVCGGARPQKLSQLRFSAFVAGADTVEDADSGRRILPPSTSTDNHSFSACGTGSSMGSDVARIWLSPYEAVWVNQLLPLNCRIVPPKWRYLLRTDNSEWFPQSGVASGFIHYTLFLPPNLVYFGGTA